MNIIAYKDIYFRREYQNVFATQNKNANQTKKYQCWKNYFLWPICEVSSCPICISRYTQLHKKYKYVCQNEVRCRTISDRNSGFYRVHSCEYMTNVSSYYSQLYPLLLKHVNKHTCPESPLPKENITPFEVKTREWCIPVSQIKTVLP